MANLLIAGCGYVGSALARARVARGDNVFGLRRNPVDMPSGVVPIAADLAVPRSLAELPAAIDVVVYAASPGGRDDAFYRTAYVEGLRNLIAALAKQGQAPRRTIFVSSTAVYGQSRGEWVDETSETAPEHFSGRRLLEAETLLRESGLPGVVLRLGGVYGPRRTRLIDEVRQGRGPARRSARHRPQRPRRLRRRARSPDRQARPRRVLPRRRQRARGRGGRAALARGGARHVAAACRGRRSAPRAARRQQALPQRASGRVGVCVPLPELPRRILRGAIGGALVPKPPRFAPTTEAMPGAVFSPVAGRLREMPGGLCPLHVGDTWMEPFTGGRMQDLSEADHPGLHRYCETRGVPALIDALVEKVRAKNGLRCERDNL